jgi:glyoxylate reductase
VKVFITRKIHEAAKERLESAGHSVETNDQDRPLTAAELREAASASDGIICLLNDKISAELLTSSPRCRVYANYAVGFDNMDLEAATQAGVALSNTPDVLTDATAELAWALLFAAARRICEGERLIRSSAFDGWAPMMLLGHSVTGKVLGIIGAGRIGTAMARMSTGFNMRILYTRKSGDSPEMQKLGATHVDLETLLRQSDFVSIHAPLTTATRHMISAPQLKLMKKDAILVNTGRGPVIDEQALADALRSNQIAAAGLDVYEREPQIEPELMKLDNVVLAPHIGSATYQARREMALLAADNVIDALAGRKPRTCLNPAFQEHRPPTG